METIIGSSTVSDLNFATTLAAGIMTEELFDKCWDTIKEVTSSYQQPGQESKEEEEEGSTMAALMRSTYEETETNCKLVRDAMESQRESKNRNSFKV